MFRFVYAERLDCSTVCFIPFHSIPVLDCSDWQHKKMANNSVHKTNRCIRTVVEWNDLMGYGTISRRSPNGLARIYTHGLTSDQGIQQLQQTAHSALRAYGPQATDYLPSVMTSDTTVCTRLSLPPVFNSLHSSPNRPYLHTDSISETVVQYHHSFPYNGKECSVLHLVETKC